MEDGQQGEINFLKYCTRCKDWCCREENIFASTIELRALRVNNICRKGNGDCQFSSNKKCSVYNKRPFECRIFPFDLFYRDGDIYWGIWKSCPVSEDINIAAYLDRLEAETLKKYSLGYINQYISHHKEQQPEKYSNYSMQLLRKISIEFFE